MSEFRLATPVVLIIFNRPTTTRLVFEQVRAARPSKLLVIADGPRTDHPDDPHRCAEARAIVEEVDWQCEILREYAPTNMGLRRRVVSGLDWAFSNVEEAIILEDDCVPDPTFFRFCEELLERYRYDERIGMISGNDFVRGKYSKSGYSYRFSRFCHIWGWATWGRAWQQYDDAMADWPQRRESGWLEDILPDDRAVRYWTAILDGVYAGEIDTWDYQWQFSLWGSDLLAIEPAVNLVSNVGFGADATHTKTKGHRLGLKTEPLRFPLVHPTRAAVDPKMEAILQNSRYAPLRHRIVVKIRTAGSRALAKITPNSR